MDCILITTQLAGGIVAYRPIRADEMQNFTKSVVQAHKKLCAQKSSTQEVIALINIRSMRVLRLTGKVWDQLVTGDAVWLVTVMEWRRYSEGVLQQVECKVRHGRRLQPRTPTVMSPEQIQHMVATHFPPEQLLKHSKQIQQSLSSPTGKIRPRPAVASSSSHRKAKRSLSPKRDENHVLSLTADTSPTRAPLEVNVYAASALHKASPVKPLSGIIRKDSDAEKEATTIEKQEMSESIASESIEELYRTPIVLRGDGSELVADPYQQGSGDVRQLTPAAKETPAVEQNGDINDSMQNNSPVLNEFGTSIMTAASIASTTGDDNYNDEDELKGAESVLSQLTGAESDISLRSASNELEPPHVHPGPELETAAEAIPQSSSNSSHDSIAASLAAEKGETPSLVVAAAAFDPRVDAFADATAAIDDVSAVSIDDTSGKAVGTGALKRVEDHRVNGLVDCFDDECNIDAAVVMTNVDGSIVPLAASNLLDNDATTANVAAADGEVGAIDIDAKDTGSVSSVAPDVISDNDAVISDVVAVTAVEDSALLVVADDTASASHNISAAAADFDPNGPAADVAVEATHPTESVAVVTSDDAGESKEAAEASASVPLDGASSQRVSAESGSPLQCLTASAPTEEHALPMPLDIKQVPATTATAVSDSVVDPERKEMVNEAAVAAASVDEPIQPATTTQQADVKPSLHIATASMVDETNASSSPVGIAEANPSAEGSARYNMTRSIPPSQVFTTPLQSSPPQVQQLQLQEKIQVQAEELAEANRIKSDLEARLEETRYLLSMFAGNAAAAAVIVGRSPHSNSTSPRIQQLQQSAVEATTAAATSDAVAASWLQNGDIELLERSLRDISVETVRESSESPNAAAAARQKLRKSLRKLAERRRRANGGGSSSENNNNSSSSSDSCSKQQQEKDRKASRDSPLKLMSRKEHRNAAYLSSPENKLRPIEGAINSAIVLPKAVKKVKKAKEEDTTLVPAAVAAAATAGKQVSASRVSRVRLQSDSLSISSIGSEGGSTPSLDQSPPQQQQQQQKPMQQQPVVVCMQLPAGIGDSDEDDDDDNAEYVADHDDHHDDGDDLLPSRSLDSTPPPPPIESTTAAAETAAAASEMQSPALNDNQPTVQHQIAVDIEMSPEDTESSIGSPQSALIAATAADAADKPTLSLKSSFRSGLRNTGSAKFDLPPTVPSMTATITTTAAVDSIIRSVSANNVPKPNSSFVSVSSGASRIDDGDVSDISSVGSEQRARIRDKTRRSLNHRAVHRDTIIHPLRLHGDLAIRTLEPSSDVDSNSNAALTATDDVAVATDDDDAAIVVDDDEKFHYHYAHFHAQHPELFLDSAPNSPYAIGTGSSAAAAIISTATAATITTTDTTAASTADTAATVEDVTSSAAVAAVAATATAVLKKKIVLNRPTSSDVSSYRTSTALTPLRGTAQAQVFKFDVLEDMRGFKEALDGVTSNSSPILAAKRSFNAADFEQQETFIASLQDIIQRDRNSRSNSTANSIEVAAVDKVEFLVNKGSASSSRSGGSISNDNNNSKNSHSNSRTSAQHELLRETPKAAVTSLNTAVVTAPAAASATIDTQQLDDDLNMDNSSVACSAYADSSIVGSSCNSQQRGAISEYAEGNSVVESLHIDTSNAVANASSSSLKDDIVNTNTSPLSFAATAVTAATTVGDRLQYLIMYIKPLLLTYRFLENPNARGFTARANITSRMNNIELLNFAIFQLYGTAEGFMVKGIKTTQIIRALKDANVCGAVTASQLDLLLTKINSRIQIAASSASVNEKVKKGRQQLKKTGTVEKRQAPGVRRDSAVQACSFDVFTELMRAVASKLFSKDVKERQRARSKGIVLGDFREGDAYQSNNTAQLDAAMEELNSCWTSVLLHENHKKDLDSFRSVVLEAKICLSGVLLKSSYRRLAPSIPAEGALSAEVASQYPGAARILQQQYLESESDAVRHVWERNTEQIRQIYSFYANTLEVRRFGSGPTKMLLSIDSCREMLSDFQVLPHVIDAHGFLNLFRICKFWEFEVGNRLLEVEDSFLRSQSADSGIGSSPPSLQQQQHHHFLSSERGAYRSDISLLGKATTTAMMKSPSVVSIIHQGTVGGNSSIAGIGSSEDPLDIRGSIGNTSLTLCGVLELLTRISAYKQKLGSDPDHALENLMRIMDASEGKAKLIKSSRKSTSVRHFVYGLKAK